MQLSKGREQIKLKRLAIVCIWLVQLQLYWALQFSELWKLILNERVQFLHVFLLVSHVCNI